MASVVNRWSESHVRHRAVAGSARPVEDRAREDDTLAITTLRPAAEPPLPDPAPPAAGSLSQRLLESLDDAKAEDVLSIDLRGKTSLADLMVIATGRSTTHVGSIADRVTRACKDAGLIAKVEGLPTCDWVLVDASDVIVHIFRPEVRQFYNLEKLWGVDRPGERQAG